MRRRYLVEGAVQGVGFRFFAYRHAQRLGLTGWVRNLPNGGVEVVAEGTESQLASLESTLRRGPVSSTVTSLGVEEIPDPADQLTSFTIR